MCYGRDLLKRHTLRRRRRRRRFPLGNSERNKEWEEGRVPPTHTHTHTHKHCVNHLGQRLQSKAVDGLMLPSWRVPPAVVHVWGIKGRVPLAGGDTVAISIVKLRKRLPQDRKDSKT